MACRACQYTPAEISDLFCNISEDLEGTLNDLQKKLDTQGQGIFLTLARNNIKELLLSKDTKLKLMLYVRYTLARLFPDYLLTDEAAEIQSYYLSIPSVFRNQSKKGPANKYEQSDSDNRFPNFCMVGREKDYIIGGFSCPHAPEPSEIDELLVYNQGNIKACQKILKDIEDLKN